MHRTQNGQAAMVVMNPERYDFLVHSAERGHIWREAIRDLAEELGCEPIQGTW